MGHTKLTLSIKNKKAYFDYEILDKYTAGIKLTGTEIKSIRLSKASLVDTFCIFNKPTELVVKNMYVSKYMYGTYNNHDERRDRWLLLTKQELRRLNKDIQVPGNAIIPLSLFINDKGYAKLEIAVCRGKKDYDKRAAIKERSIRKEIDKALKNY